MVEHDPCSYSAYNHPLKRVIARLSFSGYFALTGDNSNVLPKFLWIVQVCLRPGHSRGPKSIPKNRFPARSPFGRVTGEKPPGRSRECD